VELLNGITEDMPDTQRRKAEILGGHRKGGRCKIKERKLNLRFREKKGKRTDAGIAASLSHEKRGQEQKEGKGATNSGG